VDDAHAASAAACHSLEDHRVTDALGDFKALLGTRQNAVRTGKDRTPCSRMIARAWSLMPCRRWFSGQAR